jgi:hypothetical protein
VRVSFLALAVVLVLGGGCSGKVSGAAPTTSTVNQTTTTVATSSTTAVASTTVAPLPSPPLSLPAAQAIEALKQQTDQVNAGQWKTEWASLIPAQQRIVSSARYVECRVKATPAGLSRRIERILGTKQETAPVPGTTTQLPSVAISFVFTASFKGQTAPGVDTLHEFLIAGRWRWAMADATIAAYQKGACPDYGA